MIVKIIFGVIILLSIIFPIHFTYETLIISGYSCDEYPFVYIINIVNWIIFLSILYLTFRLFRNLGIKIEDSRLNLHVGGWMRKSIDIMDIHSIKTTISSSEILFRYSFYPEVLALSYGEGYSCAVAPIKQKEFIDHLLSINPNIILNIEA